MPITAGPLAAIALAALLLSGCTPYTYEADDPFPGFGDAVSQNLAVHIIDPQPVAAADTSLEFDGTRAALANDRYQTDTVEPPVPLRTSDVSLTGGS